MHTVFGHDLGRADDAMIKQVIGRCRLVAQLYHANIIGISRYQRIPACQMRDRPTLLDPSKCRSSLGIKGIKLCKGATVDLRFPAFQQDTIVQSIGYLAIDQLHISRIHRQSISFIIVYCDRIHRQFQLVYVGRVDRNRICCTVNICISQHIPIRRTMQTNADPLSTYTIIRQVIKQMIYPVAP